MSERDPFHDSIVHTDAAAAASGSQGLAGEIVARLHQRPRLDKRYEIKTEVGRGAMGAVLRVFDVDLRRQLAVKVMLDDSSGGESRSASQESAVLRRSARFLEEAQITGQLDHPGIVPVHEIGLDAQGRLYFTMKLVKGRDLREIFELLAKGEEGWNLTRALNVLLRVCEAMAFAHEKGVIHRDLKPGNVMVGRFGEVYVMDWGLAKVLGAKDTHDVRLRRADASQSLVRTERRDRAQENESPLATMDGDIVGTPCYMPPEQARGRLEDIGPHSDVYSVGSMLYEMLSGHMPYCGPGDRPTPQAVLGALIQGSPTPLTKLVKGLPDELVAICEKAMARDISARYPSMAGLTDDLRAYLEGRVVSAYETGALAEIRKWIGRNWQLAAALTTAIVIAFAGLYGMLATAQRKNAELSARKSELEAKQSELELKQSELESKQLELKSTNERLSSSNEQLEANQRELREANEQQKTSEELAKRMSYAASIGAADASLKINDVAAARARLLNKYNEKLRAWEWVHLWSRCDGSVRALSQFSNYGGSPRMATHVATDAEGRVLAVCGQESLTRQGGEGVVRVLEVDRATQLAEIAILWGPVEALAVSPDGKQLAIATADDAVRLFEIPSAKPIAQWQGPRNSSYRAAIAYASDGLELFVSLSERALVALSTVDARPAREIRERMGVVTCIDSSADGTHLAVGGEDGLVRILERATGAVLRTIGERGACVLSVAFSPDGERVIASTGLGRGADPRRGPWLYTVREWEVDSGKLTSTWQDHQASVNWCDYAAGGRLVVSVSDDRSIRVRDTLRGDSWSMLGHTEAVNGGALAEHGAMLVSAGVDGAVREWSPWLGEYATLVGHRKPIHALHFVDDAERLLSVADDGGVRVWDSRSALMLQSIPANDLGADRTNLWATSPASPLCATALTNGKVRLFDVDRGEFVRDLDCGERERIHSLAFDSDGKKLAAATDRGLAYVWELDGDGAPTTLRGARGQAMRVAWLEDDETLAVGSSWQAAASGVRPAQKFSEINVFDLRRRVSTRLIENLPGEVLALDPSPDRSELLLGLSPSSDRGVLRRLDARTLDVRGADRLLEFESAAWFGEGRRIVAADSAAGVQLVDPDSGEIELTLHTALELGAVAVSPDGQRIVAGYADGSIRVWSSDSPLSRHTRRTSAVRARTDALLALETSIRREGLSPQVALARSTELESFDSARKQAAQDVVRLLRGDRGHLINEVREVCRSTRREPIDYDLALLQATVLRRLAPSSPEGLYCEGFALLRLGRYAEAEAALRAALEASGVEKAPSETQALLAWALLRSKRRDEAAAEYEAYRRARPLIESVILDPTSRDIVLEIESAFEALAPR